MTDIQKIERRAAALAACMEAAVTSPVYMGCECDSGRLRRYDLENEAVDLSLEIVGGRWSLLGAKRYTRTRNRR